MGKLNTKIKFLIIAVYTLLLFLLVFVLFSPKAIDLYESYGRTPYDDHIGIMIKVTENRQSVLETYDSNSETDKKNKEGKNEKATYDVTISLIKLATILLFVTKYSSENISSSELITLVFNKFL